jgi:hypothetical protein
MAADKGKQAMAKSNTKQAPVASTLVKNFRAAKRCGTPMVAIQTPDQFATLGRIVGEFTSSTTPTAFVSWDCARGFQAQNELGVKALGKMGGKQELEGEMPFEMAATRLNSLPGRNSEATGGLVLFVLNAQRHLDSNLAVQCMCNLRDRFKLDNRMIVLLGPQLRLPVELQTDVITLDEPLPGKDELLGVVDSIFESTPGWTATPEAKLRAVEAIQGLPKFAAEQVVAMSMDQAIKGLDLDALWERKRQQIEQTPGLTVSRDGIKFDDLGGLDRIKEFLRALLHGKARPNAVVFIDEIEKCLAGAGGDTSGVAQDQLGCLLSYMQDTKASGVLFVGHPGSGKSAGAKAAGNEAGIPTVQLDLGAAKGSLVGQSEQQLRAALKVITSVSNGSTLWIATCNSLASLPPELRRRFKCGIFFFDLPDATERAAIWDVHRNRLGLDLNDSIPDDEGWTGAEIEQCCDLAWRLNSTLQYAAEYVVPISRSAPERVEGLRQQANNKWLSASHAGVYRMDNDAVEMAVAGEGRRRMNLEE